MLYFRIGTPNETSGQLLDLDPPTGVRLDGPFTSGSSYTDIDGVLRVVRKPLTDQQVLSQQRLTVATVGDVGLLTRAQLVLVQALIRDVVKIETNLTPEETSGLFVLEPGFSPSFVPVLDRSLWQYRLVFLRSL